MDIISQVGHWPSLIFDFTWSGLNEVTARNAPKKVMRFGGTLHRIIWRVLVAETRLDPCTFGRLDLANDYMRL